MSRSFLLPRLSRTATPALAAMLLLTACGDGSESLGAAGGATALSVSFNSSPTASATPSPAGQPLVVANGADTLIISRVQMVVDEFEMEREDDDSSSCDTSDTKRSNGERSSDDGSCSRLDRGPFLLDLPLGAARSAIAVTVPAGKYEEFELELEAVDDTMDSDDDADEVAAKRAFLAANPAFRNASVRVEGTYRGAPFVYTSRPEVEMEFEFEPALLVEAGVNDNITVSVDLTSWFRTSTGAVLAPTAANRARIDSNIVASFHAFGDKNRDGREDDGRGKSRRRGDN